MHITRHAPTIDHDRRNYDQTELVSVQPITIGSYWSLASFDDRPNHPSSVSIQSSQSLERNWLDPDSWDDLDNLIRIKAL